MCSVYMKITIEECVVFCIKCLFMFWNVYRACISGQEQDSPCYSDTMIKACLIQCT